VTIQQTTLYVSILVII